MLHELGATDLESVLDRATLQGKIDTARKLHAMLGRPRPTAELLGGPVPADRPLAEPPTLCPPGPRGTLGGAAEPPNFEPPNRHAPGIPA
jgi:hypothetical protein